MPLAPARLSGGALRASAALLRLPGARALVRTSFIAYLHLEHLDAARLQGVPPWRAGSTPDRR